MDPFPKTRVFLRERGNAPSPVQPRVQSLTHHTGTAIQKTDRSTEILRLGGRKINRDWGGDHCLKLCTESRSVSLLNWEEPYPSLVASTRSVTEVTSTTRCPTGGGPRSIRTSRHERTFRGTEFRYSGGGRGFEYSITLNLKVVNLYSVLTVYSELMFRPHIQASRGPVVVTGG